jgi:protease-4
MTMVETANRSPESLSDPGSLAALTGLTGALLAEQRRARRWGIFFKLLLAAYVGALLLASLITAWDGLWAGHRPHAALVRIEGPIAANAQASAERVIQGLRRALENPQVKALVVEIDSPGGSPVQAEMIHRELRRLKAAHPEMRLLAVINDLGASAAYYAAVAADAIYANRASLVGSIGVRLESFGFTEAMARLGIERRLYLAGEHKGALDMFAPVSQDVTEQIGKTLDELHAQFIAAVRDGRVERLTGGEAVFSGLWWSGEQALTLGLVDGIGDRRQVLDEVLGLERGLDYTVRRDWLDRIGRGVGAAVSQAFGDAVGAIRF